MGPGINQTDPGSTTRPPPCSSTSPSRPYTGPCRSLNSEYFLSFFFTLLYLELCGRFSDLYMDVEDEARRTYLGMVTAMDYAVGEVVTALKEANMLVV